MGKDTEISWTDSTFNPWRGCTKVSHGCTNCYAETLSHRNPAVLGVWGDKGARVVAADSAWREPLKWDKVAKSKGERHRVFCASLADVFEDRMELEVPRTRLFALIEQTPNLDWLLLTKRPENVLRMVYDPWCKRVPGHVSQNAGDGRCWAFPLNVWIGTSVEDQETANERIPLLLQVPATVRFLSMEPLLGPVNLREHWYTTHNWHDWLTGKTGLGRTENNFASHHQTGQKVDWVIVGGESGPQARPMHPDWVRSIRDQCVAAEVPFHFKQFGEWAPAGTRGDYCFNPGASIHDLVTMDRVGKKHAGRMLDGRTWDEFPTTEATPR